MTTENKSTETFSLSDLIDKKSIDKCLSTLKMWCDKYALPKDHGWDHFLAVYQHGLHAIQKCQMKLNKHEVTSILLACLLHDIDDRKIKCCFDDPSLALSPASLLASPFGPFPFAQQILIQSDCKDFISLVIELIALVSTSVNGNSDDLPLEQKWKYLPRDCDRLEALGKIGICRVMDGGQRSGLPFYTETTPFPRTEKDIWLLLQQRPLCLYVEKKSSASVLDHFYDKLLHLHVVASRNSYVYETNQIRMKEMMEWLLEQSASRAALDAPRP